MKEYLPNKKNEFKNNINYNKNKFTKNNKNFDFKKRKTNAIKSLNEVEAFLTNLKNIKNYLKLYKFLK